MRNNKGVTLVELLVVIVVMGIIAGFSIPAVGNIIENANKDAVLNDAIQVENAARLYCSSTIDAAHCELGASNADATTFAIIGGTPDNLLDDFVDGLDNQGYDTVTATFTSSGWIVSIVDAEGFNFSSTVPPSQSDRGDIS